MLRALLLTPLLLLAPAVAAQSTLGFSGNICGGACGAGSEINQDYGSTTGLAVSWRTLDGPGDAGVVTPFVQAGRYSGNPDEIPPYGPDEGQTAAFGAFEAAVGEARFELTGPGMITLLSIDTIVYDRFQGRSSVFRIYDLEYNELFNSGEIELLTLDWSTVDFGGVSSTKGLILQWGGVFETGDESQTLAYPLDDQGIDTLVFELETAAVPEPQTWAMLIAGFGLVGAVARRRRPLAA